MRARQGRIAAEDMRTALDRLMQKYPESQPVWVQRVGMVDGKGWWEYMMVEEDAE